MKKILLACLMVGLCVSNMNFVSATLSTDINIGNHEIESYSDLKYLSERLDDFILKNPSSSEEEQDTFLNEVIQSSEFEMQKSMNRSAGDYLPGYNNLNSQKKNLQSRVLQKQYQFIRVLRQLPIRQSAYMVEMVIKIILMHFVMDIGIY